VLQKHNLIEHYSCHIILVHCICKQLAKWLRKYSWLRKPILALQQNRLQWT